MPVCKADVYAQMTILTMFAQIISNKKFRHNSQFIMIVNLTLKSAVKGFTCLLLFICKTTFKFEKEVTKMSDFRHVIESESIVAVIFIINVILVNG